eukprot:15463605-Alexandrium_andersonii.AAC.1
MSMWSKCASFRSSDFPVVQIRLRTVPTELAGLLARPNMQHGSKRSEIELRRPRHDLKAGPRSSR